MMKKCYHIEELQKYVESLLKNKESIDIEFKSAAGGFPGSFWDTYSSFANTEGGTIVLGVKETKGTFSVDNLSEEQIDKYKKEFWSNVNNKNTVNCNLLKDEDVSLITYKWNKLLLFNIPRADRSQRPIYRTTNPYNGTFRRNYEGDYKCTEKEVQRMFADADDSQPADSRILENYTIDDIDMETVKQYRQLFDISKPRHIWLTLNDIQLITKLGGYRKDRKTGKEGFTLAGLLFFGKTESITDPECAPNYFPDYREISDTVSEPRWVDRVCPDGTWEANLFQFYKRVSPKLVAALPKPFRLKDGIRIDETPTHVAVREAFINTLVHTDYSIDATIVIEQYTNRFLFSNPGTLLISKSQYYNGGESICRNKSLQKMFMMIGSAEKAGSGVDKIMSGWKDANWKSPYIEEKYRPDKIVLTLPMESLLDQNVTNNLINIFGKDIVNIGYDKLVTLSIAYTEKEVTNERLRYVVDKHSSDISKLLKELCNQGYLRTEGNGRGTKYHLILNLNELNGTNIASKDSNVACLTPNVASKDLNVACLMPNVACSEIETKYSIKKKKISKHDLEALIIANSKQYISLDELAIKVERNSVYLKNHIIPKMIEKGLIERLYPYSPRHPNQKYKAKDIEYK